MSLSKVTITVQAFQIDSSFDVIQKHCEATHKQLSQFISHQFDELLRKDECKWGVSMEQFSELVTKETKKDTCRFRLRVEVNERVDAFAINSSHKKSLFLSFLLYQVAVQLDCGMKKRFIKKRDEKVA